MSVNVAICVYVMGSDQKVYTVIYVHESVVHYHQKKNRDNNI